MGVRVGKGDCSGVTLSRATYLSRSFNMRALVGSSGRAKKTKMPHTMVAAPAKR